MTASDQERLAELVAMMPFAARLGIVLDLAEAAEVRGRLPWAADLCTVAGALHGGTLMAFADSLGGVCAFLNLPAGSQTTTISSNTTFLRAARGGELTGTARPLHAGRTVIAVQTELVGEDGRPVAQTTQAQAVLAQR